MRRPSPVSVRGRRKDEPATARGSAPALMGPPWERTRALSLPRAVGVRAHAGKPLAVDGVRVEAVRESWLVEDRWWTERPLRRRYWELLDARGRNLVVFHELPDGGWFAHRG